MFTTPQDFYTQATKYFSAFPKTAEELQSFADKSKAVIDAETKNVKEVIVTYNKALKGDASINEISAANKKAQELAVSARFAAIMAMPGGIFMIPALVEASKEYNFDFIPASVAKEFDI